MTIHLKVDQDVYVKLVYVLAEDLGGFFGPNIFVHDSKKINVTENKTRTIPLM